MIQFSNHAFRGLDQSLRQLFEIQLAMGEAVRSMIALVPDALARPDPAHFLQAKQIDRTVNEAERDTERRVSDIINKFGTSGEDLRFLIGSIKVSGTLERIADKTKNAIKHLGRVGAPLPAPIQSQLASGAAAIEAMVPLALEQVVDYQPERTRALLAHGATAQQSYKQILLLLQAGGNTASADDTHATLIAKNIEQAADMLVEIMKIGHQVNFDSKYEKTSADAS